MHGCVAVTAVTVQNSMGVKGFHRSPRCHRRPDRSRGERYQNRAAKTGMLGAARSIARRSPIPGMRRIWRVSCPSSSIPVCASMHGDPLLHPSALDSLRSQLFPLATLVTPNLDEVRLHRRRRGRRRCLPARRGPVPCTHLVRNGRWSRSAICGHHRRVSDLVVRRHRLLRVRRAAHRYRRRTTAPADTWRLL